MDGTSFIDRGGFDSPPREVTQEQDAESVDRIDRLEAAAARLKHVMYGGFAVFFVAGGIAYHIALGGQDRFFELVRLPDGKEVSYPVEAKASHNIEAAKFVVQGWIVDLYRHGKDHNLNMELRSRAVQKLYGSAAAKTQTLADLAEQAKNSPLTELLITEKNVTPVLIYDGQDGQQWRVELEYTAISGRDKLDGKNVVIVRTRFDKASPSNRTGVWFVSLPEDAKEVK